MRPVYITIGNLPSRVRNSPSTYAVHLLALLPIPPKKKDHPEAFQKRMRIDADDKIQQILSKILEPLRNPYLTTNGWSIACSDNTIRRCYPVLATWLADIAEKTGLAGVKHQHCVQCECPKDQYGDYPDGGVRATPRDMTRYINELQSISTSSNTEEISTAQNNLLESGLT